MNTTASTQASAAPLARMCTDSAVAVACEAPGSASALAPSSSDENETQATHGEGTIRFSSSPADQFRYWITSDKLETVLGLEGVKSYKKWECRLDDAAMKKAGPVGMELPRQIVTGFLVSKLGSDDLSTDPHELSLRTEGDRLALTFTLQFGGGFSPSYELMLMPVAVSREDRLESQLVDVHGEMEEMRSEMSKLRAMVETLMEQKSNASGPSATKAGSSKVPPSLNANAPTFGSANKREGTQAFTVGFRMG